MTGIDPVSDWSALARMYAGAEALVRMGAWECELPSDRLRWTPGVYDLFGLARGSVVDRRRVVDLYEETSRIEMEALRAEALRSGTAFSLDAHILTATGEHRWIRLSAAVVREDGRAVLLYGAKQDVTREKMLWERLRLQAERDSLTGLANRDLFESRLRAALRGDAEAVAALVLVDLDHFKQINDRFGHAAGDAALCEAARRLTRCFGDAILVARIGGDEFAVLLRAPLGRARIEQAVAGAVRDLRRPVAWNGRAIDLSASVGVALVSPARRPSREGLFIEADAALYAVKAAGRAAYRLSDAIRPNRRRLRA